MLMTLQDKERNSSILVIIYYTCIKLSKCGIICESGKEKRH